MPSEQVDMLVRAFKIAWVDYYQDPGRRGAVAQDSARPALAQFLVDRSRDGLTDEADLVAAGLKFLISLEEPAPSDGVIDTPRASWNVRLENAGARFVSVGRVRLAF
jgi:hypothetical protein